jgi:hypothetical protein
MPAKKNQHFVARRNGDAKSQALAAGDEPRRVASRLRRAAWQSESGRTAFDRSLPYRPFDVG